MNSVQTYAKHVTTEAFKVESSARTEETISKIQIGTREHFGSLLNGTRNVLGKVKGTTQKYAVLEPVSRRVGSLEVLIENAQTKNTRKIEEVNDNRAMSILRKIGSRCIRRKAVTVTAAAEVAPAITLTSIPSLDHRSSSDSPHQQSHDSHPSERRYFPSIEIPDFFRFSDESSLSTTHDPLSMTLDSSFDIPSELQLILDPMAEKATQKFWKKNNDDLRNRIEEPLDSEGRECLDAIKTLLKSQKKKCCNKISACWKWVFF